MSAPVYSLRRLRLNAGMSYDDLVEATGVSKGIIARADRGESAPRNPADKLAIARVFELQVTDLWPLPDEATAEAVA